MCAVPPDSWQHSPSATQRARKALMSHLANSNPAMQQKEAKTVTQPCRSAEVLQAAPSFISLITASQSSHHKLN